MAKLREHICWAMAPVPFRGLKVAVLGIAIMSLAGLTAFLERPPWLLVLFCLGVGFLGWTIAALGFVSHWRWYWRPERNRSDSDVL